jgi:hypothetical protein
MFEELPTSAVRLITRYARTRHIPGTNRLARVCRSWRDAALNSNDQERLQLLLALEGLTDLDDDAFTSSGTQCGSRVMGTVWTPYTSRTTPTQMYSSSSCPCPKPHWWA